MICITRTLNPITAGTLGDLGVAFSGLRFLDPEDIGLMKARGVGVKASGCRRCRGMAAWLYEA